ESQHGSPKHPVDDQTATAADAVAYAVALAVQAVDKAPNATRAAAQAARAAKAWSALPPTQEVRSLTSWLPWMKAEAAEGAQQCHLIRDIFGNPFRTPVFEAAWRNWEHGALVGLARSFYDGQRFND